MAFYNLSKNERLKLVEQINKHILDDIEKSRYTKTRVYFSDDDTYIRKSAYLAIGKIYRTHKNLQSLIINMLAALFLEKDFKIRQTTINSAGEIGIWEFEAVEHFFDKGLFDKHHSVRNAVIGSIKKMGEKNPKLVLKWARKFLHHEDKEIRPW